MVSLSLPDSQRCFHETICSPKQAAPTHVINSFCNMAVGLFLDIDTPDVYLCFVLLVFAQQELRDFAFSHHPCSPRKMNFPFFVFHPHMHDVT